jgi:methyltransferase (TIGR00027 family)
MNEGRPSETAVRIAAHLMAAAREPLFRPLLDHPDEPYARWFVSEVSPLLAAVWNWGPTRRRLYAAYEAGTPGAALYILARKRFVSETLRRELEREPAVEQVVLIGAGLDPLCVRRALQHPAVRFYELDHPDTQSVKRRALERHKVRPANLHLVPVDLAAGDFGLTLRSASQFDPRRVTVFVAEGVLPYLPREVVQVVLREVGRATPLGSRGVFTVVDRAVRQDKTSSLARMERLVNRLAEPIRSDFTRQEVPGFLRGVGLEMAEILDPVGLKHRYLEPLGMDQTLLDGELLVTCRRI